MQYLREHTYYEDQYDLETIRLCLKLIEIGKDILKDNKEEIKKTAYRNSFDFYFSWKIRVTKGERYRGRDKSIKKQMSYHKSKQDKLDNAVPPAVVCTNCQNSMQVASNRYLDDWDSNDKTRVFFFFDCPSCKKRTCVYENGEERYFDPELCKECEKDVQVTVESKSDSVISTIYCPHCDTTKVETLNFKERQQERELKEKEEQDLLTKYRSEFCLSEKQWNEYVEFTEALEVANEIRKEELAKYDISALAKSMKINRLNVTQIENHISKNAEEQKYMKLSLDEPEFGKYVTVSFTIQDMNPSREEKVSLSEFNAFLTKLLEDTNWRLMRDSLSYRIGYLQGRLKCYEDDDALHELLSKKSHTSQKQTTNPINREKYSGHGLVQIARLLAHHEVEENARELRLKQEPEGFLLSPEEDGYQCGVCRRYKRGDHTWYTKENLFCLDCMSNIQIGVIPRLTKDETWIRGDDILFEYSIHSATRRMLEREGVLNPRELTDIDGKVYCIVYLKEENKEFFSKYPRKPQMEVIWKCE